MVLLRVFRNLESYQAEAFLESSYRAGRYRGMHFYSFAMEQHSIGFPLDHYKLGEFEGDVIDDDNCHQIWLQVASNYEGIDRQYSSDWEAVETAIKAFRYSSEAWDYYNDGIATGMEIAGWLYRRGTKLQPRHIYKIPTMPTSLPGAATD